MKRVVSVLAAALLLASVAHACPGCSDAANASDPNYGRGIFWGIVFFLTVPALIIGGIALAIRRARKSRMTPLSASGGAADGERGVALGQTPDPIR